uniref:hypothetical protein n=1 Tax=Treponema endosymbiont of Eucomonympha sp. TaxID=1580831 RepID=UPI0013969C31
MSGFEIVYDAAPDIVGAFYLNRRAVGGFSVKPHVSPLFRVGRAAELPHNPRFKREGVFIAEGVIIVF